MRLTVDFSDGGLTGTETDVYRGEDYRSDQSIGPFETADGRYRGKRWELNANGYLQPIRELDTRADADERAATLGVASDGVTLLGRLRTPADVYVVRVAPKDGRDELRFYDAATSHLVRKETHYLDRLIVTTFGDYRTSDGIAEAYRTTFSDGRPENDATETIRHVVVGAPVSEEELQMPPARRQLVEFPAGVNIVRLPARVDFWGRIIVRVDIGGRGLDFYLDSGCDDITIDRDVARELGLKSYGKWSETVAGSFSASKTVVPAMQIGKLLLTNAVVSALPFNFQNDWSTKVVGLLGYDFIAGAVLKIDYEHGTVDAIRTDFKLPTGSFVADANLDDYVPMIPVNVNGVAGDHFVIDTGADQIMVFSTFTRRNPGVVPEDGTLAFEGGDFVMTEGVGGRLHVRVQRLKKLGVNTVEFNDFMALVMWGDQPEFEGEKADGLVGASVLSAFDIYLDYANSRVVFVPNASAQRNKAARGLGSAADRP